MFIFIYTVRSIQQPKLLSLKEFFDLALGCPQNFFKLHLTKMEGPLSSETPILCILLKYLASTFFKELFPPTLASRSVIT